MLADEDAHQRETITKWFDWLTGSQLAKMKKSIPDMSLPWNLKGRSSWSKKLQIYLQNNNVWENVEFGQFRENLIFCQWLLN